MAAWLPTFEQDGAPLAPGSEYFIWTDPPRYVGSGALRLRKDGERFKPRWDVGEDVVLFSLAMDRCCALLTVDSPPWFNWSDEKQRGDGRALDAALEPSTPLFTPGGALAGLPS